MADEQHARRRVTRDRRHPLTAATMVLAMILSVLAISPHRAGANTEFVDLDGGQFTSMQLDSAGRPVIAYTVQVGFANWDMKILRCGNQSCTSGNTFSTLWTEGTVFAPFLELDGNIPVIGFATRLSSLDPVVTRLIRCTNATCSGSQSATVVDPARNLADMTLDGSIPMLLIANTIYRCPNPTCSGSPTTTEFGFIGATEIEMTDDGRPVLALQDSLGGSISILECLDAICDDHTTTTIDDGGLPHVQAFTMRQNQPILTWRNETNHLYLTRCTVTDCTSGMTSELVIGYDFNTTRPRESAVAVGSSNRPVIAYYNDAGGTLNVAYCGNPTCSRRDIYRIDDADNINGLYPQIELKGNGLPIVAGSALDGSSQVQLKVSNCLSRACGFLGVTPACEGLVADFTATAGVPLVGTPGDDVIFGSIGDDIIDGGGGDDVICGKSGNDVIDGGEGDDRITGDFGDDILRGEQGHDHIDGGDGDDTIHGNRGNDELWGGPGADRMFGYAGNDTMHGGPDDDRMHGNFGNDVIHGEAGDDRMFGYGDDDVINGGDGNDLAGGNRDNDQLNGGNGNDRMYGSDGDDELNGGAGNDTLEGNSLNDVLNGGGGNDSLDGGIDTDTCNGNSGTDTATRCETTTGVP